MIGCPSDVKDEVLIARDIIRNWSETNAEKDRIVLLPLHWSANSFPEIGAHPQKILDKQLVDRSDLLVCIFASKIGTPTDTSKSGSIEEIEEHVKCNKPVMLYFRKSIDISVTTPESLKKLIDFKENMKNKTLWCEYNDENDFKDLFKQHLQEFLNSHWLKTSVSGVMNDLKDSSNISFSEDELKMFFKWSRAEDQTYLVARDRAGFTVFMGVKNGYHIKKGKDEAIFKDYMKRLSDAGYVVIRRIDKYGNNIFEITKKGYDFAQTLKY